MPLPLNSWVKGNVPYSPVCKVSPTHQGYFASCFRRCSWRQVVSSLRPFGIKLDPFEVHFWQLGYQLQRSTQIQAICVRSAALLQMKGHGTRAWRTLYSMNEVNSTAHGTSGPLHSPLQRQSNARLWKQTSKCRQMQVNLRRLCDLSFLFTGVASTWKHFWSLAICLVGSCSKLK